MPVKCCKPDSQWRLYNDDNYEMAESGIALVRIVQRTARKILLLTGESLLWGVGQEVKTPGATGSSKQSLPYEWTREDTTGDVGSIPSLPNMRGISSMADVHGCVMCPGSIPGTSLSFNHRKSNCPAGAWWIEEWMWLSKKRTKTMAYSSVVEHPAVNRNVAGSIPAMPVAFVVAGGDCGLREINQQMNRNSA